ncbi:alcohol dehydrogenase [Dendrothele bispora CBS 962.96]|uniref:Alcohol dehydrogenase n=1 Tax=Dendrothele bispora (strain CBS 962.96) TaxID=1314807 RepID=A0A4S8L936_DENBC|nr:alcohol dehydrogenase [Dendrothele bispora CBS 962.96]
MSSLPEKQTAVRWYPPAYDIRVEEAPVLDITDPDDAIVKVTLAGLCGSDLHVYRGSGLTKDHTIGHEFLGVVVKLGSNFGKQDQTRPALYATLKVGDKVVAPFTVNCGECHVCRLGYTGRCPNGLLFGSPALEGGQAQFIRVPKAGGTLYNLSDPSSFSLSLSSFTSSSPSGAGASSSLAEAISSISDSSLLLLSDILPTGVFAALQILNHPKVQPMLTGKPWPNALSRMTSHMPLPYTLAHPNPNDPQSQQGGGGKTLLREEDRVLNLAVVGLGPVGICAIVSLLDMLSKLGEDSSGEIGSGVKYRIVAIDPNSSRREKVKEIYDILPASCKSKGDFLVMDIDQAKQDVSESTSRIGCTGVLEIVGSPQALRLSYELVRPFGVVTSVGVHGAKEVPFKGVELYNKNVSFDFGRCPARAMFPMAVEVLVKYQNVFGPIGESTSLIDKIVPFKEAKQIYEDFDKGRVGKVLFDPWM